MVNQHLTLTPPTPAGYRGCIRQLVWLLKTDDLSKFSSRLRWEMNTGFEHLSQTLCPHSLQTACYGAFNYVHHYEGLWEQSVNLILVLNEWLCLAPLYDHRFLPHLQVWPLWTSTNIFFSFRFGTLTCSIGTKHKKLNNRATTTGPPWQLSKLLGNVFQGYGGQYYYHCLIWKMAHYQFTVYMTDELWYTARQTNRNTVTAKYMLCSELLSSDLIMQRITVKSNKQEFDVSICGTQQQWSTWIWLSGPRGYIVTIQSIKHTLIYSWVILWLINRNGEM